MLHSVFPFWLHSFLPFEVFRVVHYCQTCQGYIQEVYGSPCGGLNHTHPTQGVSSSNPKASHGKRGLAGVMPWEGRDSDTDW